MPNTFQHWAQTQKESKVPPKPGQTQKTISTRSDARIRYLGANN